MAGITESISEQRSLRYQIRQELVEAGYSPYPSEVYTVNSSCAKIHTSFTPSVADTFSDISLAGRIMSNRLMGAASFVELQDHTGRLQLYFHRDTLCPHSDKHTYNWFFKKKMSIGDIIGVRGHVFQTAKGETTLHVHTFTLLTKALRPLPIVKRSVNAKGDAQTHDAFTDPEQRYRQRYVDLIVNPDIKHIFTQRTQIVDYIRQFLNQRSYLEVETPILQPIYGGASAKPFVTHHKTLDMPLYLRIANELYLKRLIVGGFEGVYEFSKDFRNEGMSRFHNPEFTQIELYVAYKDYLWMAELVEQLLSKLVGHLYKNSALTYQGQKIDFKTPFKRTTFYEAIEKYSGEKLRGADRQSLRAVAQKHHISINENSSEAQLLDKIFSQLCEPQYIHPTIVMDYPVSLSPLAKKHRTEEGLVERFEIICNTKEICNAYSELNDPVDQTTRFKEQLALSKAGDEEAMSEIDEDFLRALEYGMPPTAGLGLGIDRLTMLLTNQSSIQDVLFFPQMKKK